MSHQPGPKIMYIGVRWDADIDYWTLVFAVETIDEALERKEYWRSKGTDSLLYIAQAAWGETR